MQWMSAAVLTVHGGPDALVVRDDVPVPAPGPDQLLVEVTAAGVNNTDIWSREGSYGAPGDPAAVAGWRGVPLDLPRVQGGEVAGRVVEVGADVPAERVGERVLVDGAIYDGPGDDANPVGLLGSERDGGFAQYVTVPAQRAHDVGDSPLSDAQLACLPIAYATAMGMLERADVRDGETVLVTGASGGVGLALVQLAASRGCRVVALTSAGKEAVVRQSGAEVVLHRGEEPPAPVDVVADVVGGAQLPAMVDALTEGGRLVIAGAIAGAEVRLDVRRLYLHQRRLIGSSMHTPAHFSRLVAAARAGELQPVVARTYPLAAIHQAQQDFLAKAFVGKLVITPPQPTSPNRLPKYSTANTL